MIETEAVNPKKSIRKIGLILVIMVATIICVSMGLKRLPLDFYNIGYFGKSTSAPDPNVVYLVFRDGAFRIKPSDLGLDPNSYSNQPYGVIVDWNVGTKINTVISFETGYATLLVTPNDGLIDAGCVEAINNASKRLVDAARDDVAKFKRVTKYPLPSVGNLMFYILTPRGVYSSGNVDSHTLIADGADYSLLGDIAKDLMSKLSFELERTRPLTPGPVDGAAGCPK